MKQATLVVAQSGGPTAVINASLAGVVETAKSSPRIARIIGARFGIEGILTNQFVDLGAQNAALWSSLRRTPSAALGSCRRKLLSEEQAQVIDVLRTHNAHYFLYIGGNDSADTALRLQEEAAKQSFDLCVISIPKTIDNDLQGTDHCPGYGSAARFIAQSTQDTGLDTEAMRLSDPIKILEVAGRDAGWLAAASILGKNEEQDAPHVVCVPERPLDPDSLVREVARIYERLGYVVVVVAETVRHHLGHPIGGVHEVHTMDAFGHPTIVGTAAALARHISQALGVKARYEKPGTLQRMSMALSSSIDLQEAYAVGAEAVHYACAGKSGVMVGFSRVPGDMYRCILEPVDLQQVANRVRTLPDMYLGDDPFQIDPCFRDYALPLIGEPLLPYARLSS